MHLSRLFALSLLGLVFFGCESGTSPSSQSVVASGRWEAKTNTATEKLRMEFPTTDSLCMLELVLGDDSAWHVTDTVYVARISSRTESGWTLASPRGRMVRRNPSGIIDVELFEGHLVVHLATSSLLRDGADSASLVGRWKVRNNYRALDSVLELKSNGQWTTSGSNPADSGDWNAKVLQSSDFAGKDVDPLLARYLVGKESLTLFTSAYLMRPFPGGIQLMQYGDGAILDFAPVP